MKFSKLLSGLSSAWQSIRFGTGGSGVQIAQPRPNSLPDRRDFLKLFGMGAVGTVVAYSFPSIIVPQNIVTPQTASELFEHLSHSFHSFHSFSAAELSAAQRELIARTIEQVHAQESGFLKALEKYPLLNYRGRREPLIVC